MSNFTKGDSIKKRMADALVKSDIHFENDQIVAILDIMDELGIPDVYEALQAMVNDCELNNGKPYTGTIREANNALAKAEGKETS